MKFTIYKYLKKHAFQFQLVKLWIKLRFPIPERIKRQLTNEIHAEMISRLMNEVIKGKLTKEKSLEIHYNLGKEIGQQVKEFLSIKPENANDLSKIIDFLHNLLLIKGKQTVVSTEKEAISRWFKCSLCKQLNQSEYGYYYCHLYQEMYKGVLFSINTKARANSLNKTCSQWYKYCELKTWIK